ncbi:MAG: imidazole glycerol phosphate synthase subunit HisH [Aureliella sp.]
MSSACVTIVDYQMGNLRSVQKALEHVGACATISDKPEEIAAAARLILPGVGAFGDAMRELESRHLVEPIIDFIRGGQPFLGICLGLQLLFETGEEGGSHRGLGVIPGRVKRFELPPEYKVPHMGWNRVTARQPGVPLLEGLPENPYFYFVHSYYVEPKDESISWLTCDYGGEFCAAIARDNLFATQFHPEKSQNHGLKLLENFSRLPA